MVKNYLKIIVFSFILLAFSITSCDSDDDVIALNKQEEKLQKINSFEVNPGKNRVVIKGIVQGTMAEEVKVFWEDENQSISIPVNNSEGNDTILRVIENLEEGIYEFEAVTVSKEGNISEKMVARAEVFGSSYEAVVKKREIASNILRESNLDIDFEEIDRTTGIKGTEFYYQNTAGKEVSLFVDSEKENLSIYDFKNGTSYKFRSVYIPAPTSVDTFYTAFETVTPVTFPELKNASVPFEATAIQDRWGILADWTTNEAARNHDGYGGWDEWNDNIFNMESGWGSPAITNGKIYQTVTAGEGDFILQVELRDTNHNAADEGGSYFVITNSDTIPDTEMVETSPDVIAYQRITDETLSYQIPFSITSKTEITIGQVSTQWGETPGRYCNIISWEIVAD